MLYVFKIIKCYRKDELMFLKFIFAILKLIEIVTALILRLEETKCILLSDEINKNNRLV